MRWLEEQGIGYETPWARVPLVPAAVVYDLNEGSATVRPTADSGYRACASAVPRVDSTGRHGAGTGVSVGKWAGIEHRSPGGIGAAELHLDDLHLTALAVVNAVGDVLGEDGGIIAGARGEGGRWLGADDRLRRFRLERGAPVPGTNTTLVAVMTNARLSKVDANRVARRMHNGFARALRPVHTSFDGDAAFTLASGLVDATLDLVAEAAADTAAAAIRNAVRSPLG
jgi:L-aminopeptidase/D-esterase-like protein